MRPRGASVVIRFFRPSPNPIPIATSKSCPYKVACPCGQTIHGQRQARYQIAPCPNCGRPLFILPLSPFQKSGPALSNWTSWRSIRLVWLMPFLAGGVTIAILVILFVILRPYLARPQAIRGETQQLREQIQTARKTLAKGEFQRAAVELDTVYQQAATRSTGLARAELRELDELHAQADLLARLLSQSLQELLEQAKATVSDDEWNLRFSREYKDKAIVFDAFAWLNEKRQPELTLKTIQAGEVEARVALEEIHLLSALSLGVQPRRLVFGARLASFAKEPGGRWVIGFQLESGVLLTDQDAFRACVPTLVDQDPAILTVLQRQKEWLDSNVAGRVPTR